MKLNCEFHKSAHQCTISFSPQYWSYKFEISIDFWDFFDLFDDVPKNNNATEGLLHFLNPIFIVTLSFTFFYAQMKNEEDAVRIIVLFANTKFLMYNIKPLI